MFQAERYHIILEILKRKKSVSIETLCKNSFCSVATMRRDLISLEKAGLITRRRGGASIIAGANTDYAYDFRDSEHNIEKTYICSIAEDYLSDGISLFLDSSSTVFPICSLLERYKNISVVTNGIAMAFSLAQNVNVDTYIAGGRMKKGSVSIVGEFASSFIQNFKADVAIISCRGVDEGGAYEASQEQALVKQQMMQNAKTTILLCDSSKFGHSYFYKLSGFSGIEAVITEKEPAKEISDAIIKSGCEILF
ncbi:MAG: DeoR/GlpR family DNA-binding transcription regulator [Oscillospiraceae bacterium]